MPCPRIERVEERLFEGEESVLHVIERILAPLGLRVDGSSPWVDARLLVGSRVQTGILEPLASGVGRAIRGCRHAPLGVAGTNRGRLPPPLVEPMAASPREAADARAGGSGSPPAVVIPGCSSPSGSASSPRPSGSAAGAA